MSRFHVLRSKRLWVFLYESLQRIQVYWKLLIESNINSSSDHSRKQHFFENLKAIEWSLISRVIYSKNEFSQILDETNMFPRSLTQSL